MPSLINSISSGAPASAVPAPRALSTAGGGDVASAIKIISDALRSGSGATRLKAKTGTLAEKAALVTLTGSSLSMSKRDATQYFGAVGATPDATPTWGELVTAIANS